MEPTHPSADGARPVAPTTCAGCGAPLLSGVPGQTLCDRCQGLAQLEPAPSPLQEARVGDYRLIHEIGAGRYAHSWLAQDSGGHKVVVKLLRRYAPDGAAVQRFIAEAQRIVASRELEHPNLADLLDGGVHLADAFFLVYEAGGEVTLADELRSRGRLMASRAVELCAQAAEGLGALHRAGILHRDLKPANVGVTRTADGGERVLLLDSATSHLLDEAGIRETGPLPLSSAAYCSPEEASGSLPDARSDLYALGVLLFQLLTGRLPVLGSTASDLLRAHREHAPLRVRDGGKQVHEDLEALVQRLLAKEPDERPSTGDEAAVLLRSLVDVAEVGPLVIGAEPVEDPLPIVGVPRAEPDTDPLVEVDPGLERAMLGEVGPQPVEGAPGIPRWAPFIWPAWLPRAALVAGAAIAICGAALLLRSRAKGTPTPPPAAVVSLPRTVDVPPVVLEPPRAQDQAERTRRPPSPYARKFDGAQKALWTGRTAKAESILRGLLRRQLSAVDRARASKLMGDAEVKKGRRAIAASWYRKAQQLYDDPADKERMEKLLQATR